MAVSCVATHAPLVPSALHFCEGVRGLLGPGSLVRSALPLWAVFNLESLKGGGDVVLWKARCFFPWRGPATGNFALR